MRVMVSLVAAGVLLAGCHDASGPEAVALQFRGGVATEPIPSPNVAEEPFGFLRVVGGYRDGGCGAIGATAERAGADIVIEIGPWREGCDLISLAYAYEATVVGLPPGVYRVKVIHRPGAGPRELALESHVTLH